MNRHASDKSGSPGSPGFGAGAESLPDRPRRVLVAEDELLLAASLAADLRELDYEVVGPAPNGQVAVEITRAQKPDLALLDIQMPVMDGLEAAEVIFGQLNVPVVVLSAYSDLAYINAGVRIGVFSYILKPVTRDQLKVALPVAWNKYVDLRMRKTVEQAKWRLVERLGMTEQDAESRLQQAARCSRRRKLDIADALLRAFDEKGDEGLRAVLNTN